VDRLEAAIRELTEAIRADIRPEPRESGPRLLSIDEAAAMLGIGRTAMYGLIGSGKCGSVKVGRRRLVPSTSLTTFIANGES
jgi:excisionase family DNA binding protein